MPRSVFTDAYSAVTSMVVELRQAHGLTQAQLAARLGKPQQFISKVERGDRRIDVVELYAIIRAIGADPATAFKALLRRLPTDVTI